MEKRMDGKKIQDLISGSTTGSAFDRDVMSRFLEDVIMHAKLWMTFLDRKGTVLIWNEAAETITGYPAGDVLGRNDVWKWLYPDPEYRAKVTSTIVHKIHDREEIENYETLIRTRTGETRRISWNTRGLSDEDGAVIGYILLGNDITEIAAVKAALKEREAMYRSLVESTDDSIYLVDQECRYLFINTNHLQRLGLDPAQYIGTPYADSHSPDDTALFCDRVKQVFSTGKVTEDEIEHGTRWFLRNFSPVIEHATGDILAVTIVSAEITRLKQAEAEIRDREERYRTVVNTQNEFICRFRPDGTHIFVNEAYCRYFGKPCDEILGHRFRPSIPKEDREQVREFFAGLTPKHPSGTIEHRIRMPNGEIRWQQWSEQAIFAPDGTLTEYQSVGRDVTGLKLAEKAVRESNEQAVMFIKEAAMRLKTPVEVVEENIRILMDDLGAGDVGRDELLLRLAIQVRSMEQVQVNLRDLNRAIVDRFGEISPASRRFLTE